MKSFFSLTVVQKYLIGFTGLGLAFFLLVHMLGNGLIFVSAENYNLYAAQLEQKIFILFEMGLIFLFFVHILLAVVVTIKNRRARDTNYTCVANKNKSTAWYHKNLIAQGAVILVFVILHLITFKFGNYYEITYGDKTVRDLFRLVVEAFKNPVNVIWYIIALFVLCVHLFHGVKSAFQSFGLSHSYFNHWIKIISIVYTVLVTFGFVSIPIYVFFFLTEGMG